MGHSVHNSRERSSGPCVLDPPPAKDAPSTHSSPELNGLLHKVQRNWEDYGWATAVKKTLAYLVRAVYFRQVYRIYRIKLADAAPPMEGNVYDFKFRMLTPQDMDAIAQIEEIAEWLRGKLQSAIAAGQPCLVALDRGRVAGFNLIRMDRAPLILVNLTRKLHPNCAWSEHIAVQKEYRRSGLGGQLRLRIFQELKRQGVRRLYGGTLVNNAASLALARSVGFKEIADIRYRKFLAVEKWRYERVRE